jgi:hypothetical protein
MPATQTHTPGPWEASATGAYVITRAPNLRPNRTHGYGCGNNHVCDLNDHEYHEYSDIAEQQANARLIAAAPDLLAAVKGLVAKSTDIDGDWSQEWRLALDAIAKAEGR